MLSLLLTVAPLTATAQFEVMRGDCTPDLNGGDAATAQRAPVVSHRLPAINTHWDASRTYRQMVILVEFSDLAFCRADAHALYDSIMNVPGYNQGNGPGCVVDYYRDQSRGLFNLQFDVFGPVKVSQVARPSQAKNYGKESLAEATRLVIQENPGLDYSVYDWNGDGEIEQVIFVYAGCGGNINGQSGYIWPNTSIFSTVTTPDGKSISNYSASAELWVDYRDVSCGFATLCHEFSHCLGLPDIYSTTSGAPVCDEWDLMDGGLITNNGWCPPNFTAMEKVLMGWLEPVELTDSQVVTGMMPIAEGGDVYRIKHSDKEWLLLENRQQRGWDLGVPGKGLVVYHVYNDGSAWRSNRVNTNPQKHCFDLVHADNMDYDAWKRYVSDMKLKQYAHSPKLNSRYLSTSTYPWSTDSTTFVNDWLTETSVPAPVMFYPNEAGDTLLNKPITNITMSDDGLVSFVFLGNPDADAIRTVSSSTDSKPAFFDLRGRRVGRQGKGIYLTRNPNGVYKKILK